MMSAKTHGCATPPHRTPEGTPCKRPSCAQCAAGVALGAEKVFTRVVTCGARYRGPLIPNPESRCYSMPQYAFPCGWTCFKYALAALESDRCACRNDNIHLCLLSDVHAVHASVEAGHVRADLPCSGSDGFFGEHGAVMRREFQLTSLVYFGLRFFVVPDDMLYLSNFRGFQLSILQDAPHLSVSKSRQCEQLSTNLLR